MEAAGIAPASQPPQALSRRAGVDAFETPCCQAALASLAGRTGSGITANEGATAAARAIECLTRAVVRGYRNTNELRIESALDLLRNRPDFKNLMVELEKKSPPLALSCPQGSDAPTADLSSAGQKRDHHRPVAWRAECDRSTCSPANALPGLARWLDNSAPAREPSCIKIVASPGWAWAMALPGRIATAAVKKRRASARLGARSWFGTL